MAYTISYPDRPSVLSTAFLQQLPKKKIPLHPFLRSFWHCSDVLCYRCYYARPRFDGAPRFALRADHGIDRLPVGGSTCQNEMGPPSSMLLGLASVLEVLGLHELTLVRLACQISAAWSTRTSQTGPPSAAPLLFPVTLVLVSGCRRCQSLWGNGRLSSCRPPPPSPRLCPASCLRATALSRGPLPVLRPDRLFLASPRQSGFYLARDSTSGYTLVDGAFCTWFR